MSVKFDGKINLLSGHYQDIIISENIKGNYCIKVTPNEIYHLKELDQLYSYPKYDGLSDLEKLEQIIDSYLYHNTIFMLTNYGRLKFHSGNYQAINAYHTFVDGYQSISRAMYLKLSNKQLSKVTNRIFRKYEEDRIRHLDKILKCQKIEISLSGNSTSYFINHEEAYIDLFSSRDDNFKLHPLKSELKFLKALLIEFIKKNGYHVAYDRNDRVFLHEGEYHNLMELEDCLMPYILQAQSKIYHMEQEQYHNITIEEYLCLFNQQQVSTLSKKI